MNVTVKDLLDAGVHFGHQVRRWNPKSKPYVYANRHGISIIDLEKTYDLLEKAAAGIEEVVASGKSVLLLGTKRQAQEPIREMAAATNMPFCVNRWLGGTLTNYETVSTSLGKYKKYLRMEEDGSLDNLPGKEAAVIRRQMSRMHRNFEGLLDLKSLPGAIFVIDTHNEAIAVAEANRLDIPLVALVDSNSDPTLIDFPIPGNDDSTKSIRIVIDVIVEAIQTGVTRRVEAPTHRRDITPLPEGYEDMDFDDRRWGRRDEEESPTEEASTEEAPSAESEVSEASSGEESIPASEEVSLAEGEEDSTEETEDAEGSADAEVVTTEQESKESDTEEGKEEK